MGGKQSGSSFVCHNVAGSILITDIFSVKRHFTRLSSFFEYSDKRGTSVESSLSFFFKVFCFRFAGIIFRHALVILHPVMHLVPVWNETSQFNVDFQNILHSSITLTIEEWHSNHLHKFHLIFCNRSIKFVDFSFTCVKKPYTALHFDIC